MGGQDLKDESECEHEGGKELGWSGAKTGFEARGTVQLSES